MADPKDSDLFRYAMIAVTPITDATNPDVLRRSLLGNMAFPFKADQYLVNTDGSITRGGDLWPSSQPREDGTFVFELATALPFYLPSIEGQGESVLTLEGADYFICHRMFRAFAGAPTPAPRAFGVYFLIHLGGIEKLAQVTGSLAHCTTAS